MAKYRTRNHAKKVELESTAIRFGHIDQKNAQLVATFWKHKSALTYSIEPSCPKSDLRAIAKGFFPGESKRQQIEASLTTAAEAWNSQDIHGITFREGTGPEDATFQVVYSRDDGKGNIMTAFFPGSSLLDRKLRVYESAFDPIHGSGGLVVWAYKRHSQCLFSSFERLICWKTSRVFCIYAETRARGCGPGGSIEMGVRLTYP